MTTHGMPFDIRSEPLSIATICIFGCCLVEYLAILSGPDPLVLAAEIITIGFFLLESIYSISNMGQARAGAELARAR